MKWSRLRIKTIADAEDVIISALYDIGLEGAQIEDSVPLTAREKEQMFVDIMPDAPEDDGIAYLSFYIEQEENESEKEHQDRLASIVEQVKQELDDIRTYMEIGDGSIAVSETEDKDWINNWKEFFHQFYIDDILVIPSWEKMDEADSGRMVLHIDPGTAFGTGMHETTQLCIRQLRRFVTSQTRILDVGTGSGILSILSLMFGAKEAVGTDLDPCAINAVDDNKKNNGIKEEQFHLLIGDIITDKKIQDAVGYDSYDIVVANILADVLVPLTPVIAHHLKSGGVYITSGIIDDKEEVVREAVTGAGLDILDVTYQGEWVCVTAMKPV
ncbi:MAG: 50S ribosomal protein L11 methyltransferase [Lachnospiraceae bacterium]|nr:50S ribosomal protein L11 methyltransferase [Lachnospiraceae bacterium]